MVSFTLFSTIELKSYMVRLYPRSFLALSGRAPRGHNAGSSSWPRVQLGARDDSQLFIPHPEHFHQSRFDVYASQKHRIDTRTTALETHHSEPLIEPKKALYQKKQLENPRPPLLLKQFSHGRHKTRPFQRITLWRSFRQITMDSSDGSSENPSTNVKFTIPQEIQQKIQEIAPRSSLSFADHQKYCRQVFDKIINEMDQNGTATVQLQQPSVKKLEIELIDHTALDAGECFSRCPCVLDMDRDTSDTLFLLENDTGITLKELFVRLRDVLYGEEDKRKYDVMRGSFDGWLRIKGFNWMISEGSILSDSSRRGFTDSLPCLYVEMDGRRLEEAGS